MIKPLKYKVMYTVVWTMCMGFVWPYAMANTGAKKHTEPQKKKNHPASRPRKKILSPQQRIRRIQRIRRLVHNAGVVGGGCCRKFKHSHQLQNLLRSVVGTKKIQTSNRSFSKLNHSTHSIKSKWAKRPVRLRRPLRAKQRQKNKLLPMPVRKVLPRVGFIAKKRYRARIRLPQVKRLQPSDRHVVWRIRRQYVRCIERWGYRRTRALLKFRLQFSVRANGRVKHCQLLGAKKASMYARCMCSVTKRIRFLKSSPKTEDRVITIPFICGH